MNFDVFILFLNATLIPIISAIVVIAIFRKQYLPVIKRLENEEKEKRLFASEKQKCEKHIN